MSLDDARHKASLEEHPAFTIHLRVAIASLVHDYLNYATAPSHISFVATLLMGIDDKAHDIL